MSPLAESSKIFGSNLPHWGLSMKEKTGINWNQEQNYLSNVLRFIQNRIAQLTKQRGELELWTVEKKKEAYDEHMELKQGPDNAVLQQQLYEAELLNQKQLEEIRQLKQALSSPYFARVDFRFDGEAQAEAFYIGLHTLIDTEAYAQYVLDWRSPLAELYYDADEGRSHFRADGRDIWGEVLQKFQYVITHGVLRHASLRGKEMYDEMLSMVLGNKASSKMKEIVSTLQKEQNRVIRENPKHSVLIQGVAGSGKTSVALHRAAWLMYADEKLQGDQILLISPNEYFSDYVAEVLPQLGETKARMSTIDRLSRDLLGEKEGRFERMDIRPASIEKKRMLYDLNTPKQMRDFISLFEKKNFSPEEIRVGGSTVSSETLADLYKRFDQVEHFARLPLILQNLQSHISAAVFHKAKDRLMNQLWNMYQVHRIGGIYEAYRQFVKNGDFDLRPDQEPAPNLGETLYGDAYRDTRSRHENTQGEALIQSARSGQRHFSSEKRRLTAVSKERLSSESVSHGVQNRDLDLRRQIAAGKISPEDLLAQQSAQVGQLKVGSQGFDQVDLRFMASLYVQLFGTESLQWCQHLIVDEFEDLGYPEHMMLSRLFSCPKTLIGDVYQNLVTQMDEAHLDLIESIYRESQSHHLLRENFSKAYRCSKEIGEFCAAMLPDIALEAVERSAGPVKLLELSSEHSKFSEVCAFVVDELKTLQYRLIAVLFADEAKRDDMYEAYLKLGLKALRKPYDPEALNAVPMFLTAEEARGMEFDAVLLAEIPKITSKASPERETQEIDTRSLYVSASRALHQLIVLSESRDDLDVLEALMGKKTLSPQGEAHLSSKDRESEKILEQEAKNAKKNGSSERDVLPYVRLHVKAMDELFDEEMLHKTADVLSNLSGDFEENVAGFLSQVD